MPTARKHQISLEATPYYHCTSRCVRKAFLCGIDEHGNNYEHRRQWVEDRILELGAIFCIDVCAYAVMSNHHHVVLHINTATMHALTDIDVCLRWHKLFKGTALSQGFVRGDSLDQAQWQALKVKLDEWRLKLTDISWFMRCLNEPIARQANDEDRCTGRFWEARFKSQALLDEKALAACMAYVDLNPIRAKMAKTPEHSHHTSIKKRLESLQQYSTQPKSLYPFAGNLREPMPQGLPFPLKDYVELVDITGRLIRADKRGYISPASTPILERLGINDKQWLTLTTQFERQFKGFAGASQAIKAGLTKLGYQRFTQIGAAQQVFG